MIEAKQNANLPHEAFVTRRRNPTEILKQQLLKKNDERRIHNNEPHTIYCSPLVDCAPNLELARETAEMCNLILEHTEWDIRLLSKGNLLSRVAEMCGPEMRERGIFGYSSGTPDDALAASFEIGTAKVSRRLKDLHKLQDQGYRTFGMICPILPNDDYHDLAKKMTGMIRANHCEHIWVEVLNARGQSMRNTFEALSNGGYIREAEMLRQVSGDRKIWEEHARRAFLAFADEIPAEKLRFLQYVNPESESWWEAHRSNGAILL